LVLNELYRFIMSEVFDDTSRNTFIAAVVAPDFQSSGFTFVATSLEDVRALCTEKNQTHCKDSGFMISVDLEPHGYNSVKVLAFVALIVTSTTADGTVCEGIFSSGARATFINANGTNTEGVIVFTIRPAFATYHELALLAVKNNEGVVAFVLQPAVLRKGTHERHPIIVKSTDQRVSADTLKELVRLGITQLPALIAASERRGDNAAGVLVKIDTVDHPRRSSRKAHERRSVSPGKSPDFNIDLSDGPSGDDSSEDDSSESETVASLRATIVTLRGEIKTLKARPKRASPNEKCKRKACLELERTSKKKTAKTKCTDCPSTKQMDLYEKAATFQQTHKLLPAEVEKLRDTLKARDHQAEALQLLNTNLQTSLDQSQTAQAGSMTVMQTTAMMKMMQDASALSTNGLVDVAKLLATPK
jgi:hypothetical protein